MTSAKTTVLFTPHANSVARFLKLSGKPKSERLFERHTEYDTSTELIASVAMNESILIFTTIRPLTTPTTTPSNSATAIVTGTDQPTSTMPQPAVTAEAEMVAPIDRSNTPAESGTSSPSATTIRIAFWLSTDRWVSHIVQVSGIQRVNTTQINP